MPQPQGAGSQIQRGRLAAPAALTGWEPVCRGLSSMVMTGSALPTSTYSLEGLLVGRQDRKR